MSIIIISGEVGSLEDKVASMVAEKLGYPLVNRRDVHQLAQDCDSEFGKACDFYETAYGETEQFGLWERTFFSAPAYVSLFESLHFELASRGNVVILGRGPQIVLRHIPGVLKVRIVAPTEWRAEIIAKDKNMPYEEALDFVNKFDQRRRALMESVYGVDLYIWLYDMSINIRSFSPVTAANFICQGMERIEKPLDNGKVQEQLKNLALAKKAESAIKKRISTSPYRKVEVTATSDGVVKLLGIVQDKRSKEQAEKAALEVEGVSRVENNLKTTELTF